jgi:hypothetical protein
VGDDTGWLLRQILRREDNLGLKRDFVPDMLTITNLAHIPFFLRHLTPPDYAVIV